jgi:hypothetical protein
MNDKAPTAWRWKDGKSTVTATIRPGGWPRYPDEPDGPKELCCSTLARRAQGFGPCHTPAEWKVERRERGRPHVVTGWFCTRDLPSTDAPPVDAEVIA